MKTINLAAPWSHHTIAVTTDYQAGSHEVADEIFGDAVNAGVHKEEVNGDGTATDRPARATRKVEG